MTAGKYILYKYYYLNIILMGRHEHPYKKLTKSIRTEMLKLLYWISFS